MLDQFEVENRRLTFSNDRSQIALLFIGYFIFEVPSNLALEKFSASRWIARIMVT
jgi:hypothetical protein